MNLLHTDASSITFKYEQDRCRVTNLEIPETAVAYMETEVRQLYQRHNVTIVEPTKYGTWCGRETGLSYQTMVIAYKA